MNDVEIRRFVESDIPLKVYWINDEKNSQFLHYDLPLSIEKTEQWFQVASNDPRRADFTIIYRNRPVGLIGLLNTDNVKGSAEFYIALGESEVRGKGIATRASELLIEYAKNQMGLKALYLYTEVENYRAQMLFERIGFQRKRLIENEFEYRGRSVSRYFYIIQLQED